VIVPVEEQYGQLGLLALTAVTLVLALVWARRGGTRVDPFGSGARTEHKTWVQFRVRYAVLALLFVAFDMEMVFMFPWAVVFRRVGLVAFLDMFVFVAILAAALAYAWKEGALDWED
jgi:NADH-quinone oxidoreductase subunit A